MTLIIPDRVPEDMDERYRNLVLAFLVERGFEIHRVRPCGTRGLQIVCDAESEPSKDDQYEAVALARATLGLEPWTREAWDDITQTIESAHQLGRSQGGFSVSSGTNGTTFTVSSSYFYPPPATNS